MSGPLSLICSCRVRLYLLTFGPLPCPHPCTQHSSRASEPTSISPPFPAGGTDRVVLRSKSRGIELFKTRKQTVSGYFSDWAKWLTSSEQTPGSFSSTSTSCSSSSRFRSAGGKPSRQKCQVEDVIRPREHEREDEEEERAGGGSEDKEQEKKFRETISAKKERTNSRLEEGNGGNNSCKPRVKRGRQRAALKSADNVGDEG